MELNGTEWNGLDFYASPVFGVGHVANMLIVF